MRFEKVELYNNQEIGQDELGNPITQPVLIGVYQGKITQWTVEEIALLDREITRTQRKLMTDAPINIIRQAEIVKIDGRNYSVVDIKSDFIRWRICQVKDYFQ
ncbi:hypothetical protein [Bacillus sp. FSL K6-3431]|uniref:hypothetical protein n=1 Tax=Bacillus sp. FSL K6-3431 TaxID=2921500 RepID=UPI0030FCF181